MERYSKIINKNPREIVLLKAFPCAWGRCSFCDYIDDNSCDEAAMVRLNSKVLSHVTGELGVLEIIDSASCFDLPQATLHEIAALVQTKNIQRLFFESHWMYRRQLSTMRDLMQVPITYKIGVETFDNDFRQNYLNKNADFKTPEEVRAYFDSPCIMVGIKGQTREMIARDVEALKTHFDLGTVNVYTNNTTTVKQDPELVAWFLENYAWLNDDPCIEVLYENTDFGVGD